MTSTVATPKIVGKALYLELVANTDQYSEDELRSFIGWQFGGTKQILIFPQYQDDTGNVHQAVIMNRVVSQHTPRAQWEMTYLGRYRLKSEPNFEEISGGYYNYPSYDTTEWAELSERERTNSRELALKALLKNSTIERRWTQPDPEGERTVVAGQAWVVRDNKPIVVEVTDQDMDELHHNQKTPQAVIRRINKVRDTLDKFPKKLA